MKVILTDEVEKLGGANEVVEVADGYARNFLLPRGLAMPATRSAMANLDNLKRVHERREDKRRTAAQEQIAQLEGKTLVMPAKSGAQGRLFGSIGTADIADELKKQFGIEVDRKQVVLEDAIRTVGVYQVPLSLHRDVPFELSVQVGDVPAQAPAEVA